MPPLVQMIPLLVMPIQMELLHVLMMHVLVSSFTHVCRKNLFLAASQPASKV
jgi:hypothetical protein